MPSTAEIKEHIARKKDKESAQQHTAQLMNLLNVMGTDQRNAVIAGMVEAMTREHRYIQQEFMSALQESLRIYGASGADARNIAGISWAKEAGDLVPEIPFMN